MLLRYLVALVLLLLARCGFAFCFSNGDVSSRRKQSTLFAQTEKKTVVVVGGGWAGFSAADALDDTETTDVLLLDASPRGQGGLAGGWTSPRLGMPVEAGIHGFWREYRNTIDTMERRIGLDLGNVLTPFTPSVLVSSSGRVALAPVLGSDEEEKKSSKEVVDSKENIDWSNTESVLESLSYLLPTPLDVAVLSKFNESSPLKSADRISAIGLLGVWADFGQEDPASWERYDKISADNLFRSVAGVSPALYNELVSPLLHVLTMTPGYDCSAAAALSCFHVFAMQAKGAFDVRWCRGTITEKIFDPWTDKLVERGNVRIRGFSRVTSITQSPDDSKFVVTVNDSERISCDAVVLAVGATTAKKLASSCPPLQAFSATSGWNALRGVTCVAVRLFLKPEAGWEIAKAMVDSPVFVCGPSIGGIPQLTETGFCVYDLQRLQDTFVEEEQQKKCFALEVDFFRADAIAGIKEDGDVARLALSAVSSALDTDPISKDAILDASVVRARNAVSHFCVGSASLSPTCKLGRGLYVCGDWVDRKGHASWSTEKSVVTGKQAALALAKDLGLSTHGTRVIPVPTDTPQLAALRQIASLARTVVPNDMLPPSPWVLLRQLVQSSRRGG